MASEDVDEGVGDTFFRGALRLEMAVSRSQDDGSIAAYSEFLGQGRLAIRVNVFHFHPVRGGFIHPQNVAAFTEAALLVKGVDGHVLAQAF